MEMDESWAIDHFERIRTDPEYRRQVHLEHAESMRHSNLRQCLIYRMGLEWEKKRPPSEQRTWWIEQHTQYLKDFQRNHLLKTRRVIQELLAETK